MRTHGSPATRIAFGIGLLVLCALLVALSGAGVLLFTHWGNQRVAELIMRGVNRSICGKLVIDEIVGIDLPIVRARGVRILDPQGKPAIDVERAAIEVDARRWLDGVAGWERADIEQGIVYVTEDAQGNTNMEKTFESCDGASGDEGGGSGGGSESGSELDLRNMVTSDMTLVIRGGSLPSLRMVKLHGIMRVHVLPSGTTELRFDTYRGVFTEGLPTGTLEFADVKGHVHTENARLLKFQGRGRSEGERVSFELDIFTKPKTKVQIDATFPEVTTESAATRAFAAWTKLSPTLDLRVHQR